MTGKTQPTISVVVPVYNEALGISEFHQSLENEINNLKNVSFEVIYCDDGSDDGSSDILTSLANQHKSIRYIRFTRNFGKEMATSAGIGLAIGEAIITIDADGQHPVEKIAELVDRWQNGSKVVIGLRDEDAHIKYLKKIGSRLFYTLINKFSRYKMVPRSTDFRLIDRAVQQQFLALTEHNRITRGLIDWLGYERDYVVFKTNRRKLGEATYTYSKLLKLAIDSLVSYSLSPLYITAAIGLFVLPLSIILCGCMVLNDILGDPLGWHATGTAYVVVFSLFLLGILMLSQGILGLYISHIYSETQNRPLYIIDREASIRL
jgi:polyisoprenyl-phosphate glycosyltransferase